MDKTAPSHSVTTCGQTSRQTNKLKKDIQAVKQKPEQSIISALTKFHYRRLEQKKIKLQRDKTNARRVGSLNEKGLSNKSRNKSSTADIANMSTPAANLDQQFNNLKSRMSNLQETVNNKDVKKYFGLFSECSHTNADMENENKGKTL